MKKAYTITCGGIQSIDVIGNTGAGLAYKYTSAGKVKTIPCENVYSRWSDARDALELNLKDEVKRLRWAFLDAKQRLEDVRKWEVQS